MVSSIGWYAKRLVDRAGTLEVDMTIFFSASEVSFYDDTIHSKLPADAVKVTAKRHADLLKLQGDGRVIKANGVGEPIAVLPDPPSQSQLMERLRSKRDGLLRECDYVMMQDYPISVEALAEWASYRQALRDMPEAFGDNPQAAIWPDKPEKGANNE